MKRTALILTLAVAALAATAEAQVYFRLDGGYALSMKKLNGGGLAFGGAVGLELSPQFSLELGVRRWAVPVTESTLGLSKGKYSALPIEISGRLRLPVWPRFTFTGDLGAGYALQSFSLDATQAAGWEAVGFLITESIDNGLTFHLGAGLEYALSPTLGLEFTVRYHLLRGKGTWTIAEIGGLESRTGAIDSLNFDAVTISLGVRISLARKTTDLT